MLEASESCFRQRINVYDFAAAALGVQQRSQHARMIRPRILTDDKDRIGQIEIFERDRAFTKPKSFFHAGAAGFVAHVRAVRQIVRAELPHEELIEKSGFIAGPA